jgi:hypothetical protein
MAYKCTYEMELQHSERSFVAQDPETVDMSTIRTDGSDQLCITESIMRVIVGDAGLYRLSRESAPARGRRGGRCAPGSGNRVRGTTWMALRVSRKPDSVYVLGQRKE